MTLAILLVSTLIAVLAGATSLALGGGILAAFLVYSAAGVGSCLCLAFLVVLRCWVVQEASKSAIAIEPALARDIRS